MTMFEELEIGGEKQAKRHTGHCGDEREEACEPGNHLRRVVSSGRCPSAA